MSEWVSEPRLRACENLSWIIDHCNTPSDSAAVTEMKLRCLWSLCNVVPLMHFYNAGSQSALKHRELFFSVSASVCVTYSDSAESSECMQASRKFLLLKKTDISYTLCTPVSIRPQPFPFTSFHSMLYRCNLCSLGSFVKQTNILVESSFCPQAGCLPNWG